MFAVPGWSVAASSLKTQTGTGSQKSTVSAGFTNDRGGEPKAPWKPGKRKRSQDKSTAIDGVAGDNLASLLGKVIVGKPGNRAASDGTESTKGRRKRMKKEGAHTKLSSRTDQGHANYTTKDAEQAAPIKAGNFKGSSHEEKRQSKTAPLKTHDKASLQVHTPVSDTVDGTHLTPLQVSMRQKLTSARFRHLNQILYTTPSSNSLQLFEQNPELFNEYHDGFRRQVGTWPENPVEGYARTLKERGQKQLQRRKGDARPDVNHTPLGKAKKDEEPMPLPRTDGVCTVADLGCGDAKLAQALDSIKQKLRINVLSYDLYSPSKLVIRADIAQLPLKDGSVDIAIFCLALMGTNWIDFVEEAWRVLRWKGELWVAEIKSRFGRSGRKGPEHSIENRNKPTKAKNRRDAADEDAGLATGDNIDESVKPETDVTAFLVVLRQRGFVLQNETAIDTSNKMFVKLNFVKAVSPVKGKCIPAPKAESREAFRKQRKKFLDKDEKIDGDESTVLKPCVYKIR